MADIELTTDFQASSSLARKPNGTLADVPRAVATDMHNQLLHVVTLLHSIRQEASAAEETDVDADRMTCASSRTVLLASMADEKVRSMVRALSPYV